MVHFLLVSAIEEVSEAIHARQDFTSLSVNALVLLAGDRRHSTLEIAAPVVDASFGRRSTTARL